MIEFLDAALQEEYASPHAGLAYWDTFEFQHPSFTSGFPRVVIDTQDRTLRLDPDDTYFPSADATFTACAFEWTPPSHEEGSLGEAKIAIDNVSRIIRPYLELATDQPAPIKVVYRQYRTADPTTVVARYRGLEFHAVTMTATRVEGTLKFRDFGSRNFPRYYFTITEFPALANLYL